MGEDDTFGDGYGVDDEHAGGGEALESEEAPEEVCQYFLNFYSFIHSSFSL